MKTTEYLDFKSVKNLKRNIKKTEGFRLSILGNLTAASAFLESLKAKEAKGYSKFKAIFERKKLNETQLFELCFLSLFANFECFQFDLVKEILARFPARYKSEKIATFSELEDFTSTKQIRNYFIDSYAISKSVSIPEWDKFITSSVGFSLFQNEKNLQSFLVLNSMRNVLMHSGSKTTSLLRKEIKSYFNINIPIGEKWDFDRKKFYTILLDRLSEMRKTIYQK